MKVLIVLALLVTLALAQVQHGSPLGPSGRFAMTKSWAAPPVDLNQPIVLLPLATPIFEEPQEPKLQPAARPPITPAPTARLH